MLWSLLKYCKYMYANRNIKFNLNLRQSYIYMYALVNNLEQI